MKRLKSRKVFPLSRLKKIIRAPASRRKKIVFTNGTFDILHAGHVMYLEKAKSLGDFLVIGVNSDLSVKTYKGANRPINSEKDRLRVLAALECVDALVLFSDPTPLKLITEIRPDVLVKGADWKISQIAGAREVIGWGGRVVRIPLLKGRSSSRLIQALELGR